LRPSIRPAADYGGEVLTLQNDPVQGYRIKAVLFDFDGTLTRPGALDFGAIRNTLGCPPDSPILEFIANLADPEACRAARQCLDDFEIAGAADSHPNTDAEALIGWLRRKGLALGIITRNSRASVLRALRNFTQLQPGDFDLILTRDDPPAPKPSGEGVRHAADRFRIAPCELLVVGDFWFDTQAGRAAGALTALLDPQGDPRLAKTACDFRIRNLGELRSLVRAGLPLPAGKLPNDILQRYLREFHFEDPSVLINPGVGEDIAAVQMRDQDVLILKSDPITFATDAIGRYAVLVNANDIATAGAEPRWFLTTLLLPCGITPSHVRRIMQDLADHCRLWGITLCGGHTEITDAVRRPLVVGMMAGSVRREALIDKKQMRPGDAVLLTKAVAVEGTAIIAREFDTRLRELGLTAEEIAQGRACLDHIGILTEARLAASDRMATAMHDVTEGGLATALLELSSAGRHRIAVEMEKIPVSPLTRKICDRLGLNPLGLIGSGSLLICCAPEASTVLIERLQQAGIAAARIGRVLEEGAGIEARDQGVPVEWPHFAVDEITKLF
jgi:hydrogenase expression/formation protein HypE